MSYDVQIWSARPAVLPDVLPDIETWRKEGESWVRSGQTWRLVVGPSDKVLPEDVSEDAARVLPGVEYLTEMNLEPMGAPKIAYRLLARVAKAIAKRAHGLIFDAQMDTFETPAGIRRYQKQKRDERFSLLELHWWFADGPLLVRPGIEQFVHLLETELAEAMPKRYGLDEPPQHLYSETGRRHLLDFITDNLEDIIVWYPHRPVADVGLYCNPQWGHGWQGFQTSRVCVSIEASALTQPGWHAAIKSFWRQATKIIRPFFGDVRTLDGFVRMGATHGSDMETGIHPTDGRWWRGIPRALGHAAVLGEPYLSLWPEFAREAVVEADLGFLSTDDWTVRDEASELVGGVPDRIAQRRTPTWKYDAKDKGWSVDWNTEYPTVWPFEGPHDAAR